MLACHADSARWFCAFSSSVLSRGLYTHDVITTLCYHASSSFGQGQALDTGRSRALDNCHCNRKFWLQLLAFVGHARLTYVVQLQAPKKKLSNKEKKQRAKVRKAQRERGEDVSDTDEDEM